MSNYSTVKTQRCRKRNGYGNVHLPSTPFLRIPSANDTCVEAGPGMHWQRAKISRKTFTESQCSFSIRYCENIPKEYIIQFKDIMIITGSWIIPLYTTLTQEDCQLKLATNAYFEFASCLFKPMVAISSWSPPNLKLIWRWPNQNGHHRAKTKSRQKETQHWFRVGRHFVAGNQALLCEWGSTCTQCNYHTSMCNQIGITFNAHAMSLHYQTSSSYFTPDFG